jgi:hypothetical protein
MIVWVLFFTWRRLKGEVDEEMREEREPMVGGLLPDCRSLQGFQSKSKTRPIGGGTLPKRFLQVYT